MRASTTAVGLILVIAGGVAWFDLSRSQTQAQGQTLVQSQAQTQTQAQGQQNFNQGRALLENERNTVDVVQRANAGVVFIQVRSAPSGQGSTGNAFFDRFLQQQPQEGEGSGFVIDQEGHILTNYHVAGEQGAQITVRFQNDPRSYPARLIGTAQPFDMALIKVQAPREKLKPMTLGNSDQVRVGQKTIALGNPFGLEFTVTEGIVSAVRRNPNDGSGNGGVGALVPTVVQTDAAINPGNSGGPLLNSAGEVIGINSFIYSTSGGFGGAAQSAGIGFAIPINLAKQNLADLKAGKQITPQSVLSSRPRLGVELSPSLSDYPDQIRTQNRLPESGVMVAKVEPNGPAQKAGLRAATRTVTVQTGQGPFELPVNGDVIQEADGNPVTDINDLRAVLLAKPQGQPVTLRVWRNGQNVEVRVVPQIIPQTNR